MTINNIALSGLCTDQGQPWQRFPGGIGRERVLRNSAGPQDVSKKYHVSTVICGRVKDAVVFGKSYITDRPNVGVFYGQSHRNYDAQEFLDFYREEVEAETRPHPLITEECCFLGGFSGKNRFFGHFIFEYLYRLIAFDLIGALKDLPVAVYDEVPSAWLSFIELFGVPPDRIMRIPQYPAPKFSSVWMASCPNFKADVGYALWDGGVCLLHDTLRERAMTGAAPGPKRVFIGRKDAKHRRLLNEDEVWRYLESQGFVYAEFADKPAAEQIRLVGSAEIIVAVGGSASVMTQFAPETCAIIEILPPHLVGGLGSIGFAVVLGQMFERVTAEAVGQHMTLETDMVVEVEEVRRRLAAVQYALDAQSAQA